MEIKNKKQELSELLGKINKAASYDELISLAQNTIVLASEIKTAERMQKQFDALLQAELIKEEQRLAEIQKQKPFFETTAAVEETIAEAVPSATDSTVTAAMQAPAEEPAIAPEIVVQQIFEKPTARPATISEKLESSSDQTLAGKFRKSPISDLVKAVNINQKILFTKELFKGDSFAFNEAIQKLNSFQNKEDALRFVRADLQTKNNWKEGSTAASELVELVERRYV